MPKGTKVSLVIVWSKIWMVEFRLLRKPRPPWRKELILPKKPRSGTEPPSRDQPASSKREHQRTSWKLLSQSLLSISTLLSSTHWAVNPPLRLSKTATLLYSLFTKKPIRKWSRRPAPSSTQLRSRKLTPSSLQEARRKHTLHSQAIKMPLMSPTRSESCEHFAPCQGDKMTKDMMVTEKLSWLSLYAKWNQWFNQSKPIRFSV